jgi:hypothetical protein
MTSQAGNCNISTLYACASPGVIIEGPVNVGSLGLGYKPSRSTRSKAFRKIGQCRCLACRDEMLHIISGLEVCVRIEVLFSSSATVGFALLSSILVIVTKFAVHAKSCHDGCRWVTITRRRILQIPSCYKFVPFFAHSAAINVSNTSHGHNCGQCHL